MDYKNQPDNSFKFYQTGAWIRQADFIFYNVSQTQSDATVRCLMGAASRCLDPMWSDTDYQNQPDNSSKIQILSKDQNERFFLTKQKPLIH